jgi:excisionase family DNA binding protein
MNVTRLATNDRISSINARNASTHYRRQFSLTNNDAESAVDPSLLLNTRQLAHQLAVSESAVRKWVWLKRIPVIHVGRCIRFSLGEVLAHLRQGQNHGTSLPGVSSS